jgi:hypothetical protein
MGETALLAVGKGSGGAPKFCRQNFGAAGPKTFRKVFGRKNRPQNSSEEVLPSPKRRKDRAGLGAIGIHLGDQRIQPVEFQLRPQEIDKGDGQVLTVKVALEIEKEGFQVGRFSPNIGRTPRLAAPI